jgi:hypothetical protein
MNVLAFVALTLTFQALVLEFCYIMLRYDGWRDRATRYGTTLFAFAMSALFLVMPIRLTGVTAQDLSLIVLLLLGAILGSPFVYIILRVALGSDGSVER